MGTDLNPTRRATLARLASGIIAWEFTSTLEIGGRLVDCVISQLGESDKLEIAGRDIIRALNVSCLIASNQNSPAGPVRGLDAAVYTQGTPVVLDGDDAWQIRKWDDSPDGAMRTFTLLDAD